MLELEFFIDRGGTFTDVLVKETEHLKSKFYVLKLLSEDPENYLSAPREAIRQVLWNKFQRPELSDSFKSFPASSEDYKILSIRMGTTVATNLLLERKGARVAFITTKGFKDLLEIGYQNRSDIFSLNIIKPIQLYERVLEVEERILADGQVSIALDEKQVLNDLSKLKDSGIESLAISLMHSYKNPHHELVIKKLAQGLGFKHISVSSEILPMIKFTARSSTTVIDAYLTPGIHKYLEGFKKGFTDGLKNTELLLMKSDGGLAEPEYFRGFNSIFSGPAGGMMALGGLYDGTVPLIGFDMGGTSTDVARFDGSMELNFQTELKGFFLQTPQLDINTIASGGGSRLFFDNGMFRVGPESSGSHPGPVCYRKNGYLSITDANLVLGRLIPEHFPRVFGPLANESLDYDSAYQAFEKFKNKNSLEMSVENIAQGFIDIANEVMARPIREVSLMKGFDIQEHMLVCYGGAGAQHACAIARMLGIKKIYIHKYSGIFSAYGLSQASIVIEKQIPYGHTLDSSDLTNIQNQFSELIKLALQGSDKQFNIKKFLNLRYKDTDTKFSVQEPSSLDYAKQFKNIYQREFGFDLDREIIVDDLRVRLESINSHDSAGATLNPNIELKPCSTQKLYIEGAWQLVPVFIFEQIPIDHKIPGPAIIIQNTSTIVLERGSQAYINKNSDLEILVFDLKNFSLTTSTGVVDPIKLAIYSNRFMSIAEQMGRCLERTAISTNIKERRDFSCAIFNADGDLIANAPHQPVHLGSMGHAVKKQIETSSIEPGDVILSNHPTMGGSHLPDMTVITPFFINQKLAFFTANRAHHADIGGITPGSMPSFSESLEQEGIAIKSFKIVKRGVFQEDDLRGLFKSSRRIDDNISDLKAQIASNQKGIDLLQALILESGQQEVFSYMEYIQANAERAVRELIKNFARSRSKERMLQAQDFLDDGSIINLCIKLNADDGSAVFDFTGTSPELKTNLNTPPAVVSSAILYALRAMIGQEIPLNQGCLKPINTIIPKKSFLYPSPNAPVVGGNVLSSQRIVDVILKAFGSCAGSQGCMNNISFGKEAVSGSGFGYYETIGGGAGAGPGWHGASGVHTHMTNTRITDPEILESRYPVLLEEFSIRAGSGGVGKYNGGDGLVRVFRFLDQLDLSVLTERRGPYHPYGLEGGSSGALGVNQLVKANGELVDLGAKNSLLVHPGERLVIKTPGGGGYGIPPL